MSEFRDLAHLAAHFLAVEVAVRAEAERALVRAAVVIEKTAKAELGYYQGNVGPFNGWPQLADSTLKHHEAMGVGDTPLLVTGELYASIEHEAHGNEAIVGTKLEIGAFQELGTARIPPRPFMGPAAYKSREKIQRIMGEAAMRGMVYGAVGSFIAIE